MKSRVVIAGVALALGAASGCAQTTDTRAAVAVADPDAPPVGAEVDGVGEISIDDAFERFEFGDGQNVLVSSDELAMIDPVEAFDIAATSGPSSEDRAGVVRFGNLTSSSYGTIEGIEEPGDPGGELVPALVERAAYVVEFGGVPAVRAGGVPQVDGSEAAAGGDDGAATVTRWVVVDAMTGEHLLTVETQESTT